jgi:mannitol/fructose-specific phosphotransferase system IIA component (Ntr-type)
VKLNTLLQPNTVFIDCQADNTNDFLSELLDHLHGNDIINNPKAILKKLLERESLGTTSIGKHAAVPHTKIKEIHKPIVMIGLSKKGFYYHISDKEKVHIVILILSPSESPIIHLQILAAAAAFIKRAGNIVDSLSETSTPQELIQLIRSLENQNDD